MSQTLYDWCREHPEKQYLLDEWDYQKNGDLTPKTVLHMKKKKVFWIGSKCGHSWDATVQGRVYQGLSCPYCLNKKVLPGFNDLLSQCPEIAKDWHPIKNGELSPDQVTWGSNKKVWWQDVFGREWEARISSRTSKAQKQERWTVTQRNSNTEYYLLYYLKKTFPNVEHSVKRDWLGKRMELDFFIPSLNLGIELDGWPWHADEKRDRAKDLLCKEHGVSLLRLRDDRCPPITWDGVITIICQITQSPWDALAKLFAHLNKAYGVPKPDMDLGRDSEQIVALSKEEVYKKSLANLCPELLSEWDYEKNGRLTPDLISAGSCKGVWWKCQACHGSWKTAANNRAGDCKTGCPYCAGSKVLPGYNDLEMKFPELAKQWHSTKNGSLLPCMVMPKSGKSVWWVGECGHEWDMPIAARTSGGNGCPYCAGKRVLAGFNDFASAYPNLVKDWHPTRNGELRPHQVFKASGKVVWWKCPACGYEYKKTVAGKANHPACPYCESNRLLAGVNDLATKRLDVALKWHPTKNGELTPSMVTIGSHKAVWWLCPVCKQSFQKAISDMVERGNCPVCAGRQVVSGVNDLATTHPFVAAQWHPTKNGKVTAKDVSASTSKAWWWRCPKCGHEYQKEIKKKIKHPKCPLCKNK